MIDIWNIQININKIQPLSSYQRPNGIPRTIEYMKLGSETSTNIRHSDHRETNAFSQLNSTQLDFTLKASDSTQLNYYIDFKIQAKKIRKILERNVHQRD